MSTELGGLGGIWSPQREFRGLCLLRKLLGSKEHLYWLKICLNAAEIINVQDYKRTKINVNGSTHLQESSSQAGNI